MSHDRILTELLDQKTSLSVIVFSSFFLVEYLYKIAIVFFIDNYSLQTCQH